MKKGGLVGFTYPKQALRLDLATGLIRLSLGLEFKKEFGVDAITILKPANVKFEQIRELRIVPRNRCFYAEFVYQVFEAKSDVDPKRVLGIDPGLNNWLTCISNIGTSFIIDGRHVKSMNQWFNKQVATLKEKKPQGFWSERLAHITEKRNRQIRDAINKAARLVINHCLTHRIGTVVFGWNQENKQEIKMGRQNNQQFVQIPTARLKERLSQLCQLYGIQFVETEESYTSKSSFLDADELPKFGEKPEGYQPSGKRTKRGLYRTANNWYINADCNGAANIIRKVSTKLGLDLSRGGVSEGEVSPSEPPLSRGSLTAPHRIFLWQLGSKSGAASFQGAA